MRFFSHLEAKDYPFNIPNEFLKVCTPAREHISFDPFKSEENIAIPINGLKSTVRYSLNEPLTHSFVLKAFHSNIVVRATENSPAADAHFIVAPMNHLSQIFQGKKHLAIRTADCLAVVFICECANYFFGAVTHAGWRGLTQGIVQNTLERLINEALAVGISAETFLSALHVHVAPAIFGVSYECGEDVAQALEQHKDFLKHKYQNFRQFEQLYQLLANVQKDPSLVEIVNDLLLLNQQSIRLPGKVFPDLQLLVAIECLVSGIPTQNIEVFRENTYSHPTLFSFREASHKKTNSSHRQWTHLSFPSLGNNPF